jgi:hypothetical protein
MKKAPMKSNGKLPAYDWKVDLVALVLGALIIVPFILEWIWWTRSQLTP